MPAPPAAPVLTFVVAGAVAWLVAFVVGEWARRRRILDVPNARSSHVRPTPRLGGIGLVCGVTAAALLPAGGALDAGRIAVALAIAAALAVLSLIDDLRGLPAMLRLGFHVVAAVITVPLLDIVPRAQAAGLDAALAWAAAAVAVVWIVGFVNAFNFMDGIDGIAAGQALVAGAGWTIVGAVAGDAPVVRLAAAVAGAAAGFLFLNWPPARLFMGDVGSAFLGYLLAVVPLVGREPVSLGAPAVVLVWPFLFDTTFTFIRRARRGEALMEAHRSHLYQRLTAPGAAAPALGHGEVSGRYMLLAAVGVPIAWAFARQWWAAGAAGTLVAAGLAAALWRQVVAHEARRT